MYRNWRAYNAGNAERMGDEAPLFSDARFTGQLRGELGPYDLLNTVPHPHSPGVVVPALVLRARWVLDDDTEQIAAAFRKGDTDVTGFVGGSSHDELAALIALSHGVRVVAAKPNRWFYGGETGDEGSPRHPGDAPPVLSSAGRASSIPGLARSVVLSGSLLASYPRIPWETARELARAARSYQQGVWVADSDSNLAWLLLVSAAETAANEWTRLNAGADPPPAELLEALKPDLVKELREAAQAQGDAVVAIVGSHLASVLRAQWKFVRFLLKFGLVPPIPRPTVGAVDWSEVAMKKALPKVYQHRSSALHGSQPVPPPMSEPPSPTHDVGGVRALPERPFGATATQGALWTEEDMPLNLYAFHHLVATAATAWWAELSTKYP